MLLAKDLAGEPQVEVINVLDRVPVKRRDTEVSPSVYTVLQVCVTLESKTGFDRIHALRPSQVNEGLLLLWDLCHQSNTSKPRLQIVPCHFQPSWTRYVYLDFTQLDTS